VGGLPRTLKFKIDDRDPFDQYARLHANDVVNTINHLTLPRYGLGNYVAATPHKPPTQTEATKPHLSAMITVVPVAPGFRLRAQTPAKRLKFDSCLLT
jgi:hypothetical protein